jgi:pyruvate kinase
MTSQIRPAPGATTRWRSLADLTRTKTIATVGPACAKREQLVELIEQGVDVFRLNMAHGDRAIHQKTLDDIRWARKESGAAVATLVDLAGPKIRLGQLFIDPMECVAGTHLKFVRGDTAQAADELVCSYEPLIDEIRAGDWIMLRDGLIRLSVVEKGIDHATCLVVDGGEIRSRQGVNLPGVELSVQALSGVDVDNAVWAAVQNVDYISLSFVRNPREIEQLRGIVRQHSGHALIVAKIEKREALERLESIVAVADAVMVARGDLGVEIEVEKTPSAQALSRSPAPTVNLSLSRRKCSKACTIRSNRPAPRSATSPTRFWMAPMHACCPEKPQSANSLDKRSE